MPGGERLEGEVVLDPAHLGEVEPIARPQPGPSVGAPEELVAEDRAELVVPRRVRDGPQPVAVRDRAADRQRIGVLEPERPGDAEPVARERGAKLVVRRARPARRVHEHLAQRPRVLGVRVDGSPAQRLRDDLRPAEVRPMLDDRAGRAPE